jgi:hypothetical protein
MPRVIGAALAFGLVLGLVSCGGHAPPPKRGVVEGDLGAWHFRRFQPVLDIEVMIEGNRGEGYTASYLSDEADKSGHISDKDVVNVFVTRYERDDGVIRATVKLARRLAAEQGYQVDEQKIGGARALTINGRGESWVMWPSKLHVVKIGGRGRDDVPKEMIASYADRYPSLLPGGALEGPLPPGPDAAPKSDKEKYDPDAPKPDFDKYDPNKAKLPPKKDPQDGQ